MLLERAFHATGAIAAITSILRANEAEKELADALHTDLCLNATQQNDKLAPQYHT